MITLVDFEQVLENQNITKEFFGKTGGINNLLLLLRDMEPKDRVIAGERINAIKEDYEGLSRMVECLASCPKALRGTLDIWNTFDQDLQEHYCDELLWMIDYVVDHKDVIAKDQNLLSLVNQARVDFIPLLDDIYKIMGIHVKF